MPALKDFSVMGCVNLTELNVSNCTKLESLVADETKLTTLDLSNCPLLHSFSAKKSQLSQITWGEKNELVDVYLNENALKVVDMGSMPKLENLSLERNEIEEIHLNECPKLKTMDISHNKLKSVDVSGCPALNALVYYYNPGDDGIFKVYHPTFTLPVGPSWLMTPGDENSRVTSMCFCENAPRIKTQPQSVIAKSGVPSSFKVEMESETANLKYYWFIGDYMTTDGLTNFHMSLLEDSESPEEYIRGSETNELEIMYKLNSADEVKRYFVCYIYDPDKETATYSSPIEVTMK